MIENVGEAFSLERLKVAQEKTKQIVLEVKGSVFEGMTEQDGVELVEKAYLKYGVERKWHPTKFRIDSNTILAFREKSKEVTLKKGDHFFIDIGPVIDGHEGDYGETFIFDAETSDIIDASHEVFKEVKAKFLEGELTGEELYHFAEECAHRYGYNFNDRQKGHRIGDFPHALYFKKGLSDINTIPIKDRWVLEIHLVHKSGKFGAFFEDII